MSSIAHAMHTPVRRSINWQADAPSPTVMVSPLAAMSSSAAPPAAGAALFPFPQTPTPLQQRCPNSMLSPALCGCPVCVQYRSFYYAGALANSGVVVSPSRVAFSPYPSASSAPRQPGHQQQQHRSSPLAAGQPSVALPIPGASAHSSVRRALPFADALPLQAHYGQHVDASPLRHNQHYMASEWWSPQVPLTMQPLTPLPSCTSVTVEAVCSPNGRSHLVALLSSGRMAADAIDSLLSDVVLPHLETVALDQHGCHVLRALVEVLDDAQLLRLTQNFKETLVLNMCTVSQYTRRTLQTLFERQRIDLQPVIEMLASNAQYLAAKQQGCICLMKVFMVSSPAQKAILIAPLLPTWFPLSMDPYGNYVVQCAIEFSDKVTASRYVLEHLKGHLVELSCNKFGSNVVEKIVSCLNVPVVRKAVLDEMILSAPATLTKLVSDGYGNFVIQNIIEQSPTLSDFKRIVDRLRPVITSLLPAAGSSNAPAAASQGGKSGGDHAANFAGRIDAKIRVKKNQLQPPATAVSGGSPPHDT